MGSRHNAGPSLGKAAVLYSLGMTIAVGLEKGLKLEKRQLGVRQSRKKGQLGKRVKFIRDVVREVVGFAPYEKRMMELLKVGKEKRALKLAKRRLGTHRRAKNKREEMGNSLRKMQQKK